MDVLRVYELEHSLFDLVQVNLTSRKKTESLIEIHTRAKYFSATKITIDK